MQKKRLSPDQFGGLVTILIGVVTMMESSRIWSFRISLLTGDHILTMVCGVALILLGGVLLCTKNGKHVQVKFPEKGILIKMGLTFAVLLLYVVLIRLVGYVISTLVCTTALFGIFSSYSKVKCFAMAAVFTVILYLVFILGLEMPFPRGLLIH